MSWLVTYRNKNYIADQQLTFNSRNEAVLYFVDLCKKETTRDFIRIEHRNNIIIEKKIIKNAKKHSVTDSLQSLLYRSD